MKRLFLEENERYNEHGQSLAADIYKALMPIVKNYADNDFSIRDVQNIAQGEVDIVCLSLLGSKRRAEKAT